MVFKYHFANSNVVMSQYLRNSSSRLRCEYPLSDCPSVLTRIYKTVIFIILNIELRQFQFTYAKIQIALLLRPHAEIINRIKQ